MSRLIEDLQESSTGITSETWVRSYLFLLCSFYPLRSCYRDSRNRLTSSRERQIPQTPGDDVIISHAGSEAEHSRSSKLFRSIDDPTFGPYCECSNGRPAARSEWRTCFSEWRIFVVEGSTSVSLSHRVPPHSTLHS